MQKLPENTDLTHLTLRPPSDLWPQCVITCARLHADLFKSSAAFQTANPDPLPLLENPLQIFPYETDKSQSLCTCTRMNLLISSCVSSHTLCLWVCLDMCLCGTGVPLGHGDTAWKNSALSLPLSYFSSSALLPSKFHSVVEKLGPVHPAIIGNTASLFHSLPHFFTANWKYISSCLELTDSVFRIRNKCSLRHLQYCNVATAPSFLHDH